MNTGPSVDPTIPEHLPTAAAEPTQAAELPRLTPPLLVSTERAVGEVLQLDRAADTVLRGFFRANERLGRRDRGIIAETVFDVLRNRRRYGHQAQSMRGAPTGWRVLTLRGLRITGAPGVAQRGRRRACG